MGMGVWGGTELRRWGGHMLAVLLLLSLCGSSVAQEVHDEVSRYHLFVARLSACTPSGTTPSHVLCVLNQAYASELHIARIHPTD